MFFMSFGHNHIRTTRFRGAFKGPRRPSFLSPFLPCPFLSSQSLSPVLTSAVSFAFFLTLFTPSLHLFLPLLFFPLFFYSALSLPFLLFSLFFLFPFFIKVSSLSLSPSLPTSSLLLYPLGKSPSRVGV